MFTQKEFKEALRRHPPVSAKKLMALGVAELKLIDGRVVNLTSGTNLKVCDISREAAVLIDSVCRTSWVLRRWRIVHDRGNLEKEFELSLEEEGLELFATLPIVGKSE